MPRPPAPPPIAAAPARGAGPRILPSRRRSAGARGFSLLELVVVMAIFAVVALIGVQVIAQVMQADRRLAAAADEAAELSYGLALLRADLAAAIALPFYPPNALALPALDAPAREDRFALSLGGQATVDGTGPVEARVIWEHDRATGTVTRRHWPSLIPGDVRLASPETVIFRNVSGLTVEGFVPPEGWSVGFPKPDADPDALPRALRVTLFHDRLDRIETVVALP